MSRWLYQESCTVLQSFSIVHVLIKVTVFACKSCYLSSVSQLCSAKVLSNSNVCKHSGWLSSFPMLMELFNSFVNPLKMPSKDLQSPCPCRASGKETIQMAKCSFAVTLSHNCQTQECAQGTECSAQEISQLISNATSK